MNSTIVYEENEQGEFEMVDLSARLLQRNEEIKEKLKDAYDILKKEKERCQAIRSRERVSGKFYSQLISALGTYPLMSATDFVDLMNGDKGVLYDYIWSHKQAFFELIAYYNLVFDILPNKQLFSLFMRMNTRMYGELEKHNDSDVKDLVLSILDTFDINAFGSAETGNADSKAVYNRLTLHGAGHNYIKENEKQALDNGVALPSTSEIDQMFNAKFGAFISTPKTKKLNK